MSKYVKDLEMKQMRRRLDGVMDVVVVNVVGMEAVDTNNLRLALRKKGIELQVVKNTLAAHLFDENGMGKVNPLLSGPSAVAYGGEGIAELAKEIVDWGKKLPKLIIKGACVAGDAFDAAGVEQLTKLPSRLELIGRVVSLALSPAANLVSAMNAPGANLASQLKTIYEKDEAKDDAAAPVEAAPAVAT